MAISPRLNRTVGPSSEPVTLAESRDHVELISSDTSHDTKLARFIAAAREKVESDTGYACITQTFSLSLDDFPGDDWLKLPVRPIQSVSSITYYDTNDTQQTLSTSVYGVDTSIRGIYLKNDQCWPSTNGQTNGVEITFVSGFGDESNVPRVFKQLVLLLVGQWFVHRGDERFMPTHGMAYENLLKTVSRSSYP